uniref:Uncharacterized protein n=1 Tax=Acrobeloides nanus TaxID=290746 RepID=A0A914CHL4_9BILA
MMKMASFHLMCSLGSRLPSASSTFSPNLLKNRLFTFERCRSGIGHPGQIKQIIFRQRIKTAIINSPDENVKNTLSIYFNHPDQLPLGMNGFIRFSKHHLKINEENAKDLFDLLENTPMVQEVDQVDPDVKELIDKIFEKEMAYRIKNEPSLIEE